MQIEQVRVIEIVKVTTAIQIKSTILVKKKECRKGTTQGRAELFSLTALDTVNTLSFSFQG